MLTYKIKNILVPFDFTHDALNAVRIADMFAVKFNAKIQLVNIIEPNINGETKKKDYQSFINSEEYCFKTTIAIDKYISNFSLNPNAYTYSIKYGLATDIISSLNECFNFDMIIMPDNSRHTFKSVISKYNILKIMKRTAVPVITVNKYYRIVDFKNIIISIRNIENWHEKLPFIVSLTKQTDGKIHLVGIEDNFNNKNFNLIFDKAVSLIQKENVLNSINKIKLPNYIKDLKIIAYKKNADLLAITPSASTKFSKMLYKSSFFNSIISTSAAPVFGVNLSG